MGTLQTSGSIVPVLPTTDGQQTIAKDLVSGGTENPFRSGSGGGMEVAGMAVPLPAGMFHFTSNPNSNPNVTWSNLT